MSDHIRARIETRVAEIDQEISALRDALTALDHEDAPAPSVTAVTPAQPAQTVKPAQPAQPAPTVQPAQPAQPAQRPARARVARPAVAKQVIASGALERMLIESPGQTSSALASQANAEPKQVLTLLKELEAAGSVRREGQARATRWFPYTDEDRIAERAAQLEAQSRAVKAKREAAADDADGGASGPSAIARRVAGLLTGR